MHGGTLDAQSDGAGQGSEFTIRLPLSENQDIGPSTDQTIPLGIPPKRVLVVDDNADAAQSLGSILTLLGAHVRVAQDGPEALEAFGAHDPSVVLLDIGMPGMDGYEVARTIRARFPERRPAIVALTGWGQEEDRRRAKEAGFDHHLIKPADLNMLQLLLITIDQGQSVTWPTHASPRRE
jgi:CheY-like chemotaxis protein